MSPVARGGFLILFCLLSGCAAHKRDEAVVKAAPYISASLMQPMSTLYDKASNAGGAYDEMRLGLALASGRTSPAAPEDADRASLAIIDARFQAAKYAWLKENPPGSESEVPWAHQIDLTAEEAAAITRIESATFADYWLSRAQTAVAIAYVSAGKNNSEMMILVPAINPPVLLTAEACVSAVRKSAGVTSPSQAEVVRRLWQGGTGRAIGQAVPDPTKLRPGRDYAIGPAACGSDETFNRYVALLKAANPSDAPPRTR